MHISQVLFLNSLLHLGILPINTLTVSESLHSNLRFLSSVRLPYRAWDSLSVLCPEGASRQRAKAILHLSVCLYFLSYLFQILQYLETVISCIYLISSCLNWKSKPIPINPLIHYNWN